MEDLLKILVVDDEPEARELLKYMLQERDGVSVVGTAGDVDEAVSLMKREKPHLVLLDIQMPGKDGFQFIEQIQGSGHEPGVIFVTAYEHYAIQAIRNSVFDYILKPVHQEELDSAILRFRTRVRKVQKQELHQLIETLRSNGPVRIKLNTRAGYLLIDPAEVVFCEADGNYTYIQLTSGARETTTQNLGNIEELLEGGTFFRASRSYLLNLKYLSRVDRKNCHCLLEYPGNTCSIKIPAQKIKMLEAIFTR
ncbi:MAG: response regulator transcription factor [Bacteroidia bacterium]|nr:MAG: response regulator transcription factor [Bacteroidia bacterium]